MATTKNSVQLPPKTPQSSRNVTNAPQPSTPHTVSSSHQTLRKLRDSSATRSKKAKKARKSFKSVLSDPFQIPLETLDPSASHSLLKVLSLEFTAVKEKIEEIHENLRKIKRNQKNRKRIRENQGNDGEEGEMIEENADDAMDLEIPEHRENPTSGLVLGFNACTRAMEKSKISLLILASSVASPLMLNHFPILSYMNNCPLLLLHSSVASSLFGAVLGLSSLLALGIEKGSHTKLAKRLEEEFPLFRPEIPWLENAESLVVKNAEAQAARAEEIQKFSSTASPSPHSASFIPPPPDNFYYARAQVRVAEEIRQRHRKVEKTMKKLEKKEKKKEKEKLQIPAGE